jgi:hypothetical protein
VSGMETKGKVILYHIKLRSKKADGTYPIPKVKNPYRENGKIWGKIGTIGIGSTYIPHFLFLLF